ncbi:MAG: nucleoside hydrolase, partial [Flavobacteriaceae bacterium]
PVARGAAKPWQGPFKGGVPHIHGADGQGNTHAPPSQLKAIKQSACKFIVEQILLYPNEVILAALGPLTNLADALKMEPAIANLVKEVVFMGGSAFGPGNATHASEANILSDPEAADFVFGQNWPMTMVGLDVTQKTFLSRADVSQLTTNYSKIGNQVLGAYEFYLNFYKEVNKMDGTWVHDTSVFAYLLRPEFYKTVSHALRVETAEGSGRGKTLPSPEGEAHVDWLNRPKVNICIEVEAEKVVELIKHRLLNARFP